MRSLRDFVPLLLRREYINGKVYDLSNSFLWRSGRHQAFHRADTDLTEALKQAPHGEDLIKKVPVVGILVNCSNEQP